MSFRVVLGDITKIKTTAIVNAANCSLLGGGGVDGAIHRAAGPQLLEECRKLHGCRTGEAKLTKGYRLPAKYIIHTPGPIWRGGNDGEAALLRSCYENCLKTAMKNGIRDIAFPSISTGIYAYPLEEAAKIAVNTIYKFPELEVQMVCFDERTKAVYERANAVYRKKYDCKEKNEIVYIEYQDLPMKRAFENEELRLGMMQIAKETEQKHERILHLLQAETTFRPYVHLKGREGLSDRICEKIYAEMEKENERNPLPMAEAYPFVKNDCWSLKAKDISYMKVTVCAGEDGQFDIKEIRKKMVGNRRELLFYVEGALPNEEGHIKKGNGQERTGRKGYRIIPSHVVMEQKILKCLLLDGNVDLKRFDIKGSFVADV